MKNINLQFWGIFCLLSIIVTTAPGQNINLDTNFFAPNAKLKEVFKGGVGLTFEGPAMSPDGLLYFTDVPVGKYTGEIWKYDPQTGKAVVFRSPSGKANGLVFDAEGNLLAAEGADSGGRRITRTDMKTGISVILANNFRGKLFNAPNDIVLDMRGRIYFTDPRYLGDEPIEQPFIGVYRIDLDGSVHLIAANATKPNGIAISPDQKTLYVVNNDGPGAGIYGALPDGFTGPVSTKQNEAILEYELLPDGSLKFKKQLIDLKD